MALFPDGGDADVDLLALLRPTGPDRAFFLQGVDEIGPALGARVEPLQRHQRRGVLGLDLLRHAEVLDRLLRLVQLLVVGDGDDQQDLALERRLQLLPRLRLAVERDQRLPLAQDSASCSSASRASLEAGILRERAA